MVKSTLVGFYFSQSGKYRLFLLQILKREVTASDLRYLKFSIILDVQHSELNRFARNIEI